MAGRCCEAHQATCKSPQFTHDRMNAEGHRHCDVFCKPLQQTGVQKALQLGSLSTVEAQNLRLASLAGKKMLFLGGDSVWKACPTLVQDVLRKLREYRVELFAVFQEQGKYFQDAQDGGCFDHYAFADLGADDGHEKVVAKVKELNWDIEYCWSLHDHTQQLMAHVQVMLNLPGNGAEPYVRAQDKYRARQCLAAANLNTIKAKQIYTREDAIIAGKDIGFPIIIKPAMGGASAGVYRANTEDELLKLIDRLIGDMDSDFYLSARATYILAEKCVEPTCFMDGRISEFDCELLMWHGEVVYANIVDNFAGAGSFFQEQAMCCPTVLSAEQEAAMKTYAADCVKALGFTRGAFHVECWATEEGPLLIEVNPRVGGGAIPGFHKVVYGVDPLFEFALSMLDVPINPPRHQAAVAYGVLQPNAPITGRLNKYLSFLDPVKDSLMHVSHEYWVKAEASVKGYDCQVPEWLGEVHLMNDCGEDGTLRLDILVDEMDCLLQKIAKTAKAQTNAQPVVQDNPHLP